MGRVLVGYTFVTFACSLCYGDEIVAQEESALPVNAKLYLLQRMNPS